MARFAMTTLLMLLGSATLARAQPKDQPTPPPTTVRFATFNASLNREHAGDLVRDLGNGENAQARAVAEIIQRVRPDVLLVNEFDFDDAGRAAELFERNYLAVGQGGVEPIRFPYIYTAPSNTGVPSGADLDNDGVVATEPGSRAYGNDAFGYGVFPGQYGLVIYSEFPIDRAGVRSFQTLKWGAMPGALAPVKADGTPFYGPEAWDRFRLSSKTHLDVPVRVGPRVVHVLASHPTPPNFDGPEDRNGRRNHDEIRLWANYITGGEKARYLGEDAAPRPPADFVIMGDLNADPLDGGSVAGAIDQLLKHPKVDAAVVPRSMGAAEAARLQGQANAQHKGDDDADTADFDDRAVGNLRADYVLPSKTLKPIKGGVFWPVAADPTSRLTRMTPTVASSDHRLVYLDLIVPGASPAP